MHAVYRRRVIHPLQGAIPADIPVFMPISNDLYDDPLVYDILHTPGTAREATGLERMAARFAPASADARLPWLEPACGTGRFLRTLAGRGRRAIGFDISPQMVENANRRLRRRGLDGLAIAVEADMTGFVPAVCAPGSVSFAFNTINSFRHLTTDAEALAHLDHMSRALAPGGAYAIGLSVTIYELEPPTEDVWQAVRGGTSLTQVVQYQPPSGDPRTGGSRIERVISHITVTTPTSERTLNSTYGLRTYSFGQWMTLIKRSRMEIAGVVDERGRDMDATEMGYRVFICRSRKS